MTRADELDIVNGIITKVWILFCVAALTISPWFLVPLAVAVVVSTILYIVTGK